MKKNNKKNYQAVMVLSSVFIFATGWIFFKSTFGKHSPKSEITEQKPNKIKTLPVPIAKEAVRPKAFPVIAVQESFKLQPLVKDLQQLKAIKAKVFRNAFEENTVKEFIQSPEKLQSLVLFLTDTKSLSLTSVEIHQSAVDTLLEAAKSADHIIAEELILSVIQDKQVEDPGANKFMRETLAGIKAELMYSAAFIEKQTVQNSIPGPITQKIWDNVQQAHADNVTASENERRMTLATKSR